MKGNKDLNLALQELDESIGGFVKNNMDKNGRLIAELKRIKIELENLKIGDPCDCGFCEEEK